MALIHISRNAQLLGVFKEKEVQAGIQSKHFLPNDLAWKDGMDQWVPLDKMADVWRLNTPLAPSLDGKKNLSSSLIEPAWERLSEVGFFKAIFKTIIAVLFQPLNTFSNLHEKIIRPFCYYFLIAGVTFSAPLVFQIFYHRAFFTKEMGDTPPVFIFIGFLFLLLKALLFFAVGAFVIPSIAFLSLKITRTPSSSWKGAFSTFCYSFGSASLFQVFPVVGNLVALLWGAIVFMLGLKKTHKLSLWRLFFVILLMLLMAVVFSFCLMFVFYITIYLLKFYFASEK